MSRVTDAPTHNVTFGLIFLLGSPNEAMPLKVEKNDCMQSFLMMFRETDYG